MINIISLEEAMIIEYIFYKFNRYFEKNYIDYKKVKH
jgi:hypothetical protein